MDVVGLVSGGKDSIFNLVQLARLGHRVACLANLHPPADPAAGSAGAVQELDSFMFQTVGHAALPAVAACMGLPLVRRATRGESTQRGLHYYYAADGAGAGGDAPQHDEVEDLRMLLADVRARFPAVRGVAVGALLSNYQRLRVEAVCSELGLVPLAMLWQRSQAGLLHDMVASGLEAVLVKVASHGLTPRLLGRTIRELEPELRRAGRRFGLNVCGEGGEYETMTLHCPQLFAHGRVVLDDARVVRSSDVAHLEIAACHVDAQLTARPPSEGEPVHQVAGACALLLPPPSSHAGRRAGPVALVDTQPPPAQALASLLVGVGSSSSSSNGSYVHIGGLTACTPGVAALAEGVVAGADLLGVAAATALEEEDGFAIAASSAPHRTVCRELHTVMAALRALLARAGCTLADVAFVHLYLRDMAAFGAVNAAYCEYFGAHPPSRSCVAVDLPATRSPGAAGLSPPALLLDCVAVRGSGASMRGLWAPRVPAQPPPPPRETLHVQSLSQWAPLCIGPYCQANVVAGVVHAAGSIALLPESMELVAPLPPAQCAPALLAGTPPLHSGGEAAAEGGDAVRLLGCVLRQAHQALLNVSRVLACTDSALSLAVGVTVYVSQHAFDVLQLQALLQQHEPAARSSGPAAAPSASATVEPVLGLVRAWLCGAFGLGSAFRGRPAAAARADAPEAAVARGDGSWGSNEDGADGRSDGTYSPPCSDDEEADGGSAPRVLPTDEWEDPCRERDFGLLPVAHSPPPYLSDAQLRAVARAPALALPAPLASCEATLRLPAVPAAVHTSLPVHVVVVPALPRAASVEVEAVTLQQRAVSSGEGGGSHAATNGDGDGDGGGLRFWAGSDEAPSGRGAACLDATCHYLHGRTAHVFATLTHPPGGQAPGPLALLPNVSCADVDALAALAVRAVVVHAGLPRSAVLHVRAYAAAGDDAAADAVRRALAAGGAFGCAPPAVTLVPARPALARVLLHVTAVA